MTATEPIQITLPDGRTITLNDQQAEALTKMKSWLTEPDNLFLTLAGFAGTGKTTLTKTLIDFARTIDTYYRLCVSAPTHKAKKVIERATKCQSYTIQKLLGLRPNTELENFDINNPQFDEKADKMIACYQLLIIDEASMLNADLFTLIIREAKSYNVKILFMGDEAQLPPVKEAMSKIFTEIENKIQLTKVERQKDGNPLMSVYDAIRSDISSPVDLFPHATKVNATNEGLFFHTRLTDFENQIFPMFASDRYKEDSDFIKMLTYTNDSVRLWNKKIRDYVYKENFLMPTPLLIGDILFAYNTINVQDTELIQNSSDYRVQFISDAISQEMINIYRVGIKSVDTNDVSEIQIVRESGIKNFLIRFNQLLSRAKNETDWKKRKSYWAQYYAFKNTHLLLNDITGPDGRLLVKKDIDYGYAITIHKSQGSTFTNVAISENNLDRNRNHTERNKLKYVAFSRPTHQAIILTNKSS